MGEGPLTPAGLHRRGRGDPWLPFQPWQPPPRSGLKEEGPLGEKWAPGVGGALGTPTRPLPYTSVFLKSCARAVPVGGRSAGHREARGIHTHSVLVSRAQGGPSQGLGQSGLILGDERELGTRTARHERYPPGVRGECRPGLGGEGSLGSGAGPPRSSAVFLPEALLPSPGTPHAVSAAPHSQPQLSPLAGACGQP